MTLRLFELEKQFLSIFFFRRTQQIRKNFGSKFLLAGKSETISRFS